MLSVSECNDNHSTILNLLFLSVISIDVNECASNIHDCPANSDCVDILGGFNCSCHPGYGGDACTG